MPRSQWDVKITSYQPNGNVGMVTTHKGAVSTMFELDAIATCGYTCTVEALTEHGHDILAAPYVRERLMPVLRDRRRP